jgi:hypothetical protein
MVVSGSVQRTVSVDNQAASFNVTGKFEIEAHRASGRFSRAGNS